MPRTPHHEARPEVPALARQLVPAAFLLAAALVGLAFEAAGSDGDAPAAALAASQHGSVHSATSRLDLAVLEVSAFADNEKH